MVGSISLPPPLNSQHPFLRNTYAEHFPERDEYTPKCSNLTIIILAPRLRYWLINFLLPLLVGYASHGLAASSTGNMKYDYKYYHTRVKLSWAVSEKKRILAGREKNWHRNGSAIHLRRRSNKNLPPFHIEISQLNVCLIGVVPVPEEFNNC